MSPKSIRRLWITWVEGTRPRRLQGQLRTALNTWMKHYRGPEKFETAFINGAIQNGLRDGSEYPHILAYLKIAQDLQEKTHVAVHVAVKQPGNAADLEKSQLFPRNFDKPTLLGKGDTIEPDGESTAGTDLNVVQEEGGIAAAVSSSDYQDRGAGSEPGKEDKGNERLSQGSAGLGEDGRESPKGT